MTRTNSIVLSLSIFSLAALMLALSPAALAQDPFGVPDQASADQSTVDTPAVDNSTEAPPTAKAKKPRVYHGRLPNYYPAVVTEEQRKEIYTIQMEYYDKIKALRAQIEAMTKERNSRIQSVLSAEQLKEVQRIAAEAKANRKK